MSDEKFEVDGEHRCSIWDAIKDEPPITEKQHQEIHDYLMKKYGLEEGKDE